MLKQMHSDASRGGHTQRYLCTSPIKSVSAAGEGCSISDLF